MLILLHLLLALAFVTSRADPPGPVTIQLDPWGDDSIRVRIVPSNSKIVDQTLMALLPDPPKTTTKVVPFTNAQISNGNLNVNVDENTGFLVATRLSDKKVLLNTTALSFAPTNAIVTKSNSYAITLTFAGHGSTERVYGLGEHRTSKVNQMPFYKNFSDSQIYADSTGSDVSIPWYCSSEGYGFLWNTPSYGSVNITTDSITWFTYAAQNLDIWITTTSDPAYAAGPFANLLSNYIDAVGHAPAMPTYATGFIQCKDRYRNQTQLLDVARGYVTRGLPISVIVIDWQHWVNQGDWSFNSACWPNPQAMYDELQTLGIELMVTVWPFQTPASQHWNEFNSSAFLVPLSNGTLIPYDNGQYLYDATNSKARTAFINDVMAGYGQYGIKTFWLDAAEPEHFDNTQTWMFQEGTDVEVGEAWVQQHVKAVADGMAARGIGPSDYFVLPRSAWAGTWQYSAALWSGDITSSFQELAIQVTVAQGVAMSGVPLWTTDIGGYQGGDPTDPVFQELIVRWFQFGAFCPLFRLHGHRAGGPPSDQCGPTNGDNEVWNLAPDQDHYNSIVAVMELRENLRSYVAKINQEAVKTGMPMLRPMFLAFPNDTGVSGADVENQFMFGPDWLVSPVTTYGASQWSVYLPVLPSGTTWIYWWGQQDYGNGGGRVNVSTPITEFPLFYRREN